MKATNRIQLIKRTERIKATLICAMAGMFFIYEAGYAVGAFLYHLIN